MTFPTKILYPLPPPTTNCLTSVQRAQLIRSTKKLGRILGTTPHLIDTSVTNTLGPLRIDLPFNDIDDCTFSDASHESGSSCSSAISMAYSYNSLSRSGSIRSTSTRSKSLRRSRKPAQSDTSSDSSPSRKPPMLRLTTSSPLETAPASPLAGWTPSVHSHSPSSSIDDDDDQCFTIRPHAHATSPHDSPTTPSFVIPSINSHRRNKMERLRRKLGDDVPIDLVFPSETEVTDAPSPVLEEKQLPLLPVVLGSQKASRISSARDSVSFDSPHPARRKAVPSRAPRVPPLPANAGDARQLQEIQYTKGTYRGSASLSMPDAKVRLCVIVESPSEHGLGCSEEFGVSRNPTVLQSEWYMSDDEAATVKSWSTRRGYDGWSERLNGNGAKKRQSSYRKRPMTP